MYGMCLKANNTLHSDQLAVIFWYCHHIKQGFDYTGCQSKELPPYQTRVWLHWVSIESIATILNKGLVTLGVNPKYCHHIKQGFGYIRFFRLELLDKHCFSLTQSTQIWSTSRVFFFLIASNFSMMKTLSLLVHVENWHFRCMLNNLTL